MWFVPWIQPSLVFIKHTVSADLITEAEVDPEMHLSAEVQNKFGVF